MKYDYRPCTYEDLNYIVELKDLCLRWYIEIIYGWDLNKQIELTKKRIR